MTKPTAATPAGCTDPAPTPTAPAWPGDVPSQADAEGILCAALGGLKAAEDAALESALAALTPVEVDALLGRATSIDPDAIRRAATLRYRVTAAIHGAPRDGAEVDGAALSALLGEVDGALANVAALAPSVPPEHASALEAIRNALVKEAIDLSEIAQRVAQASPDAAPASAPAPVPKPSPTVKTRIVSIDTAPEPERTRSVGAWIALAIVLALAGAYHGMRWMNARNAPPPPGAIANPPPGYLSTPGAPGGTVTLVPNGKPRDAQALEAFKAEQRAMGHEVRELRDGTLLIDRAPRGER